MSRSAEKSCFQSPTGIGVGMGCGCSFWLGIKKEMSRSAHNSHLSTFHHHWCGVGMSGLFEKYFLLGIA